MATNENIRFRLIVCPECTHQMCWVNPRLPNHCPECGKSIFLKLRTDPESHIKLDNDKATIRY